MLTTGVFEAFEKELARAGLDIVQALRVGWYNREVDATYQLPDLGGPENLALLIGNTKALWPVFLEAMGERPELMMSEDPVDDYVESVVHGARPLLPGPVEIRFAHELPPRRVIMQRIAEVSGLAARSKTGLSVHPTFGPWIALRAVVVLDRTGPDHVSSSGGAVCTNCEQTCVPLLNSAKSWMDWLAIREACPEGREYHYPEDQARYHYTKDLAFLRRRAKLAAKQRS